MRVGIGFDVHKLIEGRKLILGGVEIPYPKGLLGWSDGDVLCHSIADALLGAASLPDIGKCFPPQDLKFKDISSLSILSRVLKMLEEKTYGIINIDAVVICEEPKIGSYTEEMIEKLSAVLKIPAAKVNIKGKTTEKLFLNNPEGIAAISVALIE